jgi:hypothetical protein
MVWCGVVWCGMIWFKLNDMPQYYGLFLIQLKMEHVINNAHILKHDVSSSPSFLVKEQGSSSLVIDHGAQRSCSRT